MAATSDWRRANRNITTPSGVPPPMVWRPRHRHQLFVRAYLAQLMDLQDRTLGSRGTVVGRSRRTYFFNELKVFGWQQPAPGCRTALLLSKNERAEAAATRPLVIARGHTLNAQSAIDRRRAR